MPLDLNVRMASFEQIELFTKMAYDLGFTGIAVPLPENQLIMKTDFGVTAYSRVDIDEGKLSSMKRQTKRVRPNTMVVSAPLASVEVANWAVEDNRIDLLTLPYRVRDNSLRDTTARLAASSGTALEIPILPLLLSSGLQRSKIIKTFRESARIALNSGMPIVLASGCDTPICMRSPVALQHIGLLLGIDSANSKSAVSTVPAKIIERNQKRLGPDFVATGVEIVRRGKGQ